MTDDDPSDPNRDRKPMGARPYLPEGRRQTPIPGSEEWTEWIIERARERRKAEQESRRTGRQIDPKTGLHVN